MQPQQRNSPLVYQQQRITPPSPMTGTGSHRGTPPIVSSSPQQQHIIVQQQQTVGNSVTVSNKQPQYIQFARQGGSVAQAVYQQQQQQQHQIAATQPQPIYRQVVTSQHGLATQQQQPIRYAYIQTTDAPTMSGGMAQGINLFLIRLRADILYKSKFCC